MKKGATFLLLIAFMIALSACKSEFEKVRLSNDPQLMYEKADMYFEQEEYERAQTLYELAISAFRGQKEAEELFFKYAQTHFYLEQYILAAHYFKNFATTFINSDKKEDAEFLTAYANYKNSPIFRLDQTYTEQAIADFQIFVNTYPRSERVEQCNELIDELRAKLETKMFYEGKLYFDIQDYQSANQSFNNLLKDFPESSNAEEVRIMIVRSSYKLAENSIYEKRKERYEETIELARKFYKRYNKSSYSREARELEKLSQSALKEL